MAKHTHRGDGRFNEPDDFSGKKPKKVENPGPPNYNQVGQSRVSKAKNAWKSGMNSKKQS